MLPHVPPHRFQGIRQDHLLQGSAAVSQLVRDMADTRLQYHRAQAGALEQNRFPVLSAASLHPEFSYAALGKGQVSHRLDSGQQANLFQSLTTIEGHAAHRSQFIRKAYLF